MAAWNRRKSLESVSGSESERRLRPSLSWPHLLAMGVGAIVGTARIFFVTARASFAAASMMILRLREPSLPRIFRTPMWWLVGPLAILGCVYLFWKLPGETQARFFIWNSLGLVVYVFYAMRRSNLAQPSV